MLFNLFELCLFVTLSPLMDLFIFFVFKVSPGDEASYPANRAHSKTRRFGGDCLHLLPLGSLEGRGGRVEPAALYMGGYLSTYPLSTGEGEPFLSLSSLHRVHG